MHGDRCHFRHVEADGKPNKKSKKGGAKGSVALLEESRQLGCVSQDSHPRKSFLRESGKLGSKHTVKFSKGTWHQIKIWERESKEAWDLAKYIYKLKNSDKTAF